MILWKRKGENMRYSDVLQQHIYYIDFDPVKQCEFNGKHLGIVLRKNTDNRTVIVAPLTRSNNGVGIDKHLLGEIINLPTSLSGSESYLVSNQVRTVNAERFYSLKDDQRNKVQVKLDDRLFDKVFEICLNCLSEGMEKNSKYAYYKNRNAELLMEQAVNKAYDIKRGKNEEIIREEIKELFNNEIEVTSYLSSRDIENGILEIIEKCLR